MKYTVMIFISVALAFVSPAMAAVETWDPFIVNTLNVDQSGNVSWNVDKTNTGWTTQAWSWGRSYSTTFYSGWDKFFHPTTDNTEGGIVFKFKTSTPVPLNLNIAALHEMVNWCGRKVTLYYSDENNWANLSPMTGSKWAGWGADFETNSKWQMLQTDSIWDYTSYWNTLAGSVQSQDGQFYVRVDLSTALIPDPTWVRLHNVTLTGAVTAATPAVIVTESSDKTEVSEACLIDSYTVILATQPTSQVTIVADANTANPQILLKTGANAAAAQIQLDFTPSNWNQPQTITVVAIKDLVVEPTIRSVIMHTAYSSDLSYMNTGSGGMMVVSSVPVDVINEPYPAEDVNHDCSVNLGDIVDLSQAWLTCNVPDAAGCIKTW